MTTAAFGEVRTLESPAGTWPDAKAYFHAVSNPAQYIRDERLHHMSVEPHPQLGTRVPFGRNGRFGSVFKFTGNDETFALKVFVRNAPRRQLRYRLIGEHLTQAKLATPRLISFKYDDQGIRVRGVWYPTLVMDWSSGVPLDKYLTEWLKSQQGNRARLCNEWVQTVRGLKSHKIAHGDLQHENILVKDNGTFQLIDYDGMFVPGMRDLQLQAAEVGRPAYQHPARTTRPHRTDYFDERLDDFSALVILLSLAAVDPRTWKAHDDDDKLIISEQDLRKPSESKLLAALAGRRGPVAKLTRLLIQAAEGAIEAVPSFETVVADPDVQGLLDRSTDQPAPPRQRARGSLPPGLLPRSPSESVSSVRRADVPAPRVSTSPAAPAVPAAQASGEVRRAATPQLTSREAEVARLLAKGLSAPDIANELRLARPTVAGYLRALRTKSETDSMEALTAWAGALFPARQTAELPPPPTKKPKTPEQQRKATTRPHRATAGAAAPPVIGTRRAPREAPAAAQSQPQPQRVVSAEQLPDLTRLFDNPSSRSARTGGRPPFPRPSGTPSPGLIRLTPAQLRRQSAEVRKLTAEGEAHLRADRTQEAVRAFDQALALNSRHAPALVGRGEANRRLQRFEDALRDLKLAVRLQPNDARTLRIRSETNREAGRKVRAMADRLRAKWRGDRKTQPG